MNKSLTVDSLRHVLDYNKDTGVFTWKNPASHSMKPGQVAGTVAPGYVGIFIDKRRYYAHRLAWMYVYGEFPKNHIDHINGEKGDNRIENLRECVDGENQQNRAANRTNKTGLIGVCWSKKVGKWTAQIGLNGKTICLGFFVDPMDAHKAYLEAKKQIHTFNPNPRGV